MAKAATGKVGGRKGVKLVRWTDAEVQTLRDAVAKAPTAQAGFEVAAKALGKSKSTVQQKYYSLKRKADGGSTRRAAVPSGGYSKAQLSKLDANDLVKLIANAKDVLAGKNDEIAAAEAAELEAVKARYAAERQAVAAALEAK